MEKIIINNTGYVKVEGIVAQCPVCDSEIHLYVTEDMQPSPWWDGCYHPMFGAKCDSCNVQLFGEFEPKISRAEQLDNIINTMSFTR